MNYSVFDKPETITDEVLDHTMDFIHNELDIKCDLNIIFDDELDTGGWADIEEDESEVHINASLEEEQIIRTLIHECIHIKQAEDGRLQPGFNNQWDGEEYEDVDYYDLPWEQDAYKLEEELMERFSYERRE